MIFACRDGFAYTASDGRGGQSTATVTLIVASVPMKFSQKPPPELVVPKPPAITARNYRFMARHMM